MKSHFVQHYNMVSGVDKKEIEEAPPSFTSAVWGHFGLAMQYIENENRKVTVCKHCVTHAAYSNGNTYMN